MAAFDLRDLVGKRFAVGPNRAILEIFLFPNGHGALQRVNEPPASIKGGCTVRRGYRDQDARFPDF
jgi:hypothetical protein